MAEFNTVVDETQARLTGGPLHPFLLPPPIAHHLVASAPSDDGGALISKNVVFLKNGKEASKTCFSFY